MPAKLFVANLNFSTTEEALTEYFGAWGSVVEAKIVTDRDTGRSRGFGFVTMSTDEEAQAAIDGAQGSSLDDRPLTVDRARPRR